MNTIIGGRDLSLGELSEALGHEFVSQGYARSNDAKNADVSLWLGQDEVQGWSGLELQPSAARRLTIRLAARLGRDIEVFCITMTGDFECTLEHWVAGAGSSLSAGPAADAMEAEAAGDWRDFCDSKARILPQVLWEMALSQLASVSLGGPSEGVNQHFVASSKTGDARIDGLIAQARVADSVEFRVMAGRSCMRLGQADGSKTTLFLEESDEEVLRGALESAD